MRQHIDRDLARDAALFRQQHPFAECEHLHSQAQVVRDLEREGQTVVTDMCDLRADVVEDWLDPIEGRLLPPTITLSLPASSVDTLPDTGASTMSAPFARTFSATSRLTAGLTVLLSTTTLPSRRPARNPSAPSDTASSDFESVTMTKITSAALGDRSGRISPFHPLVYQPLRLRASSVVSGDDVSLVEQPVCHAAAHGAQADVSEICHRLTVLQAPTLSRTGRANRV